MAQATRLLGVGPFQVLAHVDLGDFRFRGEPATLDHSAAFAAWGPVLLELDQVHEVRQAALREALGMRPGHGQPRGLDHRRSGRGAGTYDRGGLRVADHVRGRRGRGLVQCALVWSPVEIHQPGQPVLDFWKSVRDARH